MPRKVLVLVASIYFISAVNLLLTPNANVLIRLDPSEHAQFQIFNVYTASGLFLALGLFGWLSALLKKEVWGYSVLMFQSVFWTLLYFLSWAETGYWKSVFGAAEYVLLAGVLYTCSRCVDVKDIPKEDHSEMLKALEDYINSKEGDHK